MTSKPWPGWAQRSRERFLVCWTYGHERERAEAAERREAIADGAREGYAEVHVDAGLWSGRPRRCWCEAESPGERKGLSGQALVDWVTAMAAKYPDNVRVSWMGFLNTVDGRPRWRREVSRRAPAGRV